jgi:hypothetical protein
MYSFGWFPGVCFLYADVSELFIRSIFIGSVKWYWGVREGLIYTGSILVLWKSGPMGEGGGGSEYEPVVGGQV